MNTTTSLSGARKRLLVGLGTAAIAIGMVGLAPAAANAATAPVITGKVSYSADPSKTLAKTGAIRLYSDTCKRITPRKVTWKGNSYRITLKRPGTYRVVYWNSSTSAQAPYGLSSRYCKIAARNKAGTGKTVTRNLEVKSNAQVKAVSAHKKPGESFRVYEAATGRLVNKATSTGIAIYPGKYKLAKVRYDTSKGRKVIVQVFGTTSKSISKGKVVTLTARLSTKVNFDTGTATTTKLFSSSANVSLGSGSATVGQGLTAALAGFPTGTTFTYEWRRAGGAGADGVIAGATGSAYTLTADDSGAQITVRVTAKKTGYVTKTFVATRSVAQLPLTETQAYSVTGAPGGVAGVGTQIQVTPAMFSETGVTAAYAWVDDADAALSSTGSYTPTADQAGRTVTLTITYTKQGYQTKQTQVDFDVALQQLTVDVNQSLLGLVGNLLAAVGVPVTVVPATFLESGVGVDVSWVGDGTVSPDGKTYTPSLGDLLDGIDLAVTYSKPGYEDTIVDLHLGLDVL